ncbi:MAG: aminotransferase class V-fold PLP-dependent enzyme, partial [Coriobacteriaceae bacterium]|nr:aminotransferase class V-fold PLP-dependent enzyme [Coriobacteriaceae bacterium]
VNLDGWDSAALAGELAERYGIATRAGLHCAPRMHAALGTLGQGCVRFSFGWFTCEDDIDAAIAALSEIAGGR